MFIGRIGGNFKEGSICQTRKSKSAKSSLLKVSSKNWIINNYCDDMKKVTLFLLLISFNFISNAQDFTEQRKEAINSFIKAILDEIKASEVIVNDYIEIVANDTLGVEPRKRIMSFMVDSIRNKYRESLQLKNKKIVSYQDYGGKKQYFQSPTSDIEILIVDHVPLLYFYFSKARILSFLFIRKGSNGYFIIP